MIKRLQRLVMLSDEAAQRLWTYRTTYRWHRLQNFWTLYSFVAATIGPEPIGP